MLIKFCPGYLIQLLFHSYSRPLILCHLIHTLNNNYV